MPRKTPRPVRPVRVVRSGIAPNLPPGLGSKPAPTHGVNHDTVLLKEAREQADHGLVDSAMRGDADAFDEIVRRYKDRVYHVIYRFVGNHEDAMDLAQEVFVRAYQGLGAFRGQAQVYTWLFSIAANIARNRLRDRGRKGRDQGVSLDGLLEDAPAVAAMHASTQANPRDAASAQEVDAALQECLTALPEGYRLAFCLRTFEGLRYEEIAETLGCPAGTVKSRLNEARKRLHACAQAKGVL